MEIHNHVQESEKKQEGEIKPMDVLAMIDKLLERKSELLSKFGEMLTGERSKRDFKRYQQEGLEDMELVVAAYNLPPEYKAYVRKNEKLIANHDILNYLNTAESMLKDDKQYRVERELKEK